MSGRWWPVGWVWRAGARRALAVLGQDVAMVEWKPSAATGWGSSENFGSEGPQTAAAAVCAAEQGSWVESGCMLEIKYKK